MRIAVVSPETSSHRRTNLTVRLEQLVTGLSEAGHDVTVICTGWARRHSPGQLPERHGSAGGSDTDVIEPPSDEPPDPTLDVDDPTAEESTDDDPPERTDGGERSSESVSAGADASADRTGTTTTPGRDDGFPEDHDDDDEELHPATRGSVPEEFTDTGDAESEITYRTVASSLDEYNQFLTKVPFAVRSANPDVVHAVASPPGTIIAASAGSTLARAPLLAEWYDPTGVDPGRMTVSRAVKSPDRLVVPSRLVHRKLRELGAAEEKLRVIPSSVRLDQIETVDPANGTDIVYARRLDEAANLESLFLGLAELRDHDWSATIIGDGPSRLTYEKQARELRIDDRVTFVGACDREERIAIYRDSHVFAQTARQCPFATELLWALASGCVGIVEYHAESSAHELVEGRDRGFRTTNPQEMADSIIEAGALDQHTLDRSFDAYDEPTVRGLYVDCYETLQERHGFW
jgi:glycosyltransferase involved in cell wall biosynthesis